MDKFLIGVYKEVGKDSTIKRIKNTSEDIKELIGGEFETIKYDDYVIIYKKDNKYLKSNISIEPKGCGLVISLRGVLFVINQDDEGAFKSITKVQVKKIMDLFKVKSFKYENSQYSLKKRRKSSYKKNKQMMSENMSDFDENDNKSNFEVENKNNTFEDPNKRKWILERMNEIFENNNLKDDEDSIRKLYIKMILKIQLLILETLIDENK